MKAPVPPRVRGALMRLLAKGRITRAEASSFAGVTRQAIDKWCRAAGFDPRARRAIWASGEIERELGMRRQLSKSEIRALSDSVSGLTEQGETQHSTEF